MEAASVHDSFAIAAILGFDPVTHLPNSFSPLLKVAAGWGGATNPVADQSYRLFRYNNGDGITASTANTETGTQGIGGIVIKASDLGLGTGTMVYGYALMAADVTATTSTQLADWTNATYYPTTTDGTTGGGGIDLAAVNGIALSPAGARTGCRRVFSRRWFTGCARVAARTRRKLAGV